MNVIACNKVTRLFDTLQVIAYSLLLLISMKLSIALLLGSLVKFIYFYHKANQQIYYNEYQYSA